MKMDTKMAGQVNSAYESDCTDKGGSFPDKITVIATGDDLKNAGGKIKNVNVPDNIECTTAGPIGPGTKSSNHIIRPAQSYHSYIINPIARHQTSPQKCSTEAHKFLGILFTLLTSFIMSLGSFLVQILQKEGGYSPFLTTFWRFVGVVVPAIPTIIYFQYYKKIPVMEPIYPPKGKGRGKNLVLIFTRAIFGTVGFVFQYYALNYLTVADTSVVSFSSPIFVIFFGRICLQEECSIFPTICAAVTVVGVMIIANPPFIFGGEPLSMNTLIGISYAGASCLSNALVYICLRFLKNVHYSLISIIFGIVGLLISIVLSFAFDAFLLPKTWQHALLFIGIAVIGYLGQIGLTLALKYEMAGIVSAFRTSDVIFSFFWQMTQQIYPELYSVLGALVVIACVSLLAFRKWLATQDPNRKLVQRLWFVLK